MYVCMYVCTYVRMYVRMLGANHPPTWSNPTANPCHASVLPIVHAGPTLSLPPPTHPLLGPPPPPLYSKIPHGPHPPHPLGRSAAAHHVGAGVAPPPAAAHHASAAPPVVWTSLGPLPRWVPGPTTQWAPRTTRLGLHGTCWREAQGSR
jgi:hypothetical protein